MCTLWLLHPWHGAVSTSRRASVSQCSISSPPFWEGQHWAWRGQGSGPIRGHAKPGCAIDFRARCETIAAADTDASVGMPYCCKPGTGAKGCRKQCELAHGVLPCVADHLAASHQAASGWGQRGGLLRWPACRHRSAEQCAQATRTRNTCGGSEDWTPWRSGGLHELGCVYSTEPA